MLCGPLTLACRPVPERDTRENRYNPSLKERKMVDALGLEPRTR